MKKISAQELDLLSHEWHPTKNENLRFTDVIPGSSKSVWWLGACGHEWETKMFARAVRGAGCPFCSNRVVLPGFNDIATIHPDWVEQWSPSNPTAPTHVLSGGKPEYAWLCHLGHEYFSSVGHKERGRSCPYCLNMKLLTGFNDLATKHPEITKEWHPQLNGTLTPETVIAGGKEKYWWLGDCGHEWETHIRRRVEGSGCHVCASQKVVVGFNDLASQFPSIAAEFHPTKNNNIEPSSLFAHSTQKMWWKCAKGHAWETKVSNRTKQNNSCAVCRVQTNKFSSKNNAITNPQLITEWHPTLNGELKPHNVNKGSHQKVWWVCQEGHEWETTAYSRTSQGSGCPSCKGKKAIIGVNDLQTLNPELSAEWHPTLNAAVKPSDVLQASNKKAWWVCSSNHSYEMMISRRTLSNYSCPVCSGHKVVTGVNDLQTVHPELSAEWHPIKNSPLTPSQVTGKGGRVKAWWQCGKAHEWEARVKDRLRGRGCPQCWAVSYISKAEQELADYIRSVMPPTVTVIQSDKKVLKGQELDIYVPERNFAVEFNGLFWHSEKAGKSSAYHYSKFLKCKQAGVQLVQVWEDEWSGNPEQVKRMVAHKLGMSVGRKVFARKTVVKALSTEQSRTFLNVNHVQGFASGSHYLGLVEESASDVVLALLVLRQESDEVGSVLNIVRYATGVHVVGGFTKLLAYAERVFAPDSFITFADHCVSDGGLYEGNGFVADKILPPDYMYVVDGVRKHKFGYRLKRFKSDPDLLWEEGLTERQLAELNDLDRVWDAGKTRYRKMVLQGK